MGHQLTNGGRATRAMLGACALALLCLAFTSQALAAPFHPRTPSLDVEGLNHACGVAVDNKGNFYASSAGESKVKVYDSSHALLTEISNVNTPCGLAVDTGGNLYLSEKATGKVLRYHPSAFPFVGAPSYEAPTTVDASGKAKGIAVDRTDNRLYVAAGDHVAVYNSEGSFETNVGEGTLTEATGVAAYSYPWSAGPFSGTDHYLWVADARGILTDRLYLFGGSEPSELKLRRTISGVDHDEDPETAAQEFGFGAAGAYLAADPGNRDSGGKCAVAGEAQACTSGHLFLYDDTHEALDEFDGSGEYLGQTTYAGFADAEPTAIAIDRSAGTNDGTIYVTAGAGAGAKALAFGPLKAPSRETLGEYPAGLSHTLEEAVGVATDSHGDVYASTNSEIRIYGPSGAPIATIEDPGNPTALAVDSTGKVYALDTNGGNSTEFEVTYFTPDKYPPDSGTKYTRHEPAVSTPGEFPTGSKTIKAIAVNPGPGAGKDQLFVTGSNATRLYKSAAEGSGILIEKFAPCVNGIRQSIAVDGARGVVYIAPNPHVIYAANEAGTECLGHIENTGSEKVGLNPRIAVDQANGHLIEFDSTTVAREYDAAGGFVAAFGAFTELNKIPQLAVDNACALQEPPLTGKACKEFDPANGTAYIAWDDSSPSHPPFDVNAFGPLTYPESAAPTKYELTVEKTGTGSGKVTSSPAGIDCGGECSAEFEEETLVTLTATASEGSEFVKWTGCDSVDGEGKCLVSMASDEEVEAEFKEKEGGEKFPLEIIVEPPDTGKVTSSPGGIECPSSCSAEYGQGTEVTLSATGNEGFKFLKWEGCDSQPAGKCLITMSEARAVKAIFAVATYPLTVVKEGTGEGKVTSSPAGIDCGEACSHEFELGQKAQLSQVAEAGSEFREWGGACSGKGPCEVTIAKATEVTATFRALPQAIVKQPHPIAYTEATLRGEVMTAQLETEYHFEYLTQQQYEEEGESFEGAQHAPESVLAPAEAPASVQAHISDLAEGTAYRFRLLVVNTAGTVEDEGEFETLARRGAQSCPNAEYRTGLSANLPDCRAYELVTPQTDGLPPEQATDGGTPSGSFSNWLTVQRGELAGERLSYFTIGTLSGFEGNGRLDGYRAERGPGDHPAAGWQSTLFSPDYAQSAAGFTDGPLQHGVAADQLYSIWENNPGSETFPETLPQGVYLRTPTGFEPIGQGSLGTDLKALSRYVSAGGTHAIFVSKEHLEEKAAPKGTEAIYDRAAGETSAEVVSVGPDGSAFGADEDAEFAGASEDGSAVVFSVEGTLFVHRAGQTIEIATGPTTSFAGISEDGARVFYAESGGKSALYVCDTTTGPCAGSGAHPPTEIASDGAFAAVSADGSRAFFSSTEALTGGEENENGEEAEPGAHNLYAWDGAQARFVGGLANADFENQSFAGIAHMTLAAWTEALGVDSGGGRGIAPIRSTPDGSVFLFQSHARLTAYDNEGMGEIYRYAPLAEAGERLLCVSCDPSGAPPSADALLEDLRPESPVRPKTMIANLTDNGKTVFFQSFDRLLPEDANDVVDVYEWTAQGAEEPECTRPGGCLALISSGQGEVPSFLYAMNADGRDIFIQTKEKLVGADVKSSPSIYDARAGGGIPEPSPPAPCQGDACQGSGSEPPALPSAGTGGSGEAAKGPKARPCRKGRHRVKGRCVKRHAKKRHRHRRAKHERRAQR